MENPSIFEVLISSISMNEIIITIVTLLFGWMTTRLGSFLDAKKQEALEKASNESAKKYIDIAMTTVREVVDYLNVEVVNDMKRASADGTLTAEEIETISAKARTQIMLILSEDAVTALQAVYGDVNELLTTWIVNAVENAKSETGSGYTREEILAERTAEFGGAIDET